MKPSLRTVTLSMLFAAAAQMSGCGGDVPLGTQHKDDGSAGAGGATGNTPASETKADAAADSGGGNTLIDASVATGGSAKTGGMGGNGSTGGKTGAGGIAGGSGGSVGGTTGSLPPVLDAGIKDGALLCDGVPQPDAGCAYGTPTWFCVPINSGDFWQFTCPTPPSDAGGGTSGMGKTSSAGGTGGAGGTSGLSSTGGMSGAGGGGGTGGTGGSTGKICGTAGGTSCPTGEFCELAAGTCGVMDAAGVCTKVPKQSECTRSYVPVCGCDGKTYNNDCERQVAMMPKDSDGHCPSSTLVVTPQSASFDTGIGLTSSPTTFTIRNAGARESDILLVGIVGTNPSAFSITSSSCGNPLPVGQTCQISVVFKAPSTSGHYDATLYVADNANVTGEITVALTGYAFPPQAQGPMPASISPLSKGLVTSTHAGGTDE